MTTDNKLAPEWLAALVPDGMAAPRRIAIDAPWNWLAAGWRDIWRAPMLSLGYGAVFASAAGLVLASLASMDMLSLSLALAGGLMLVGPLGAVGLYEISRRHSRSQSVTLGGILTAGLSARGQLAFFGLGLMFVLLLWIRVAFLLLMVFLGTSGAPPPSEFMHTLLFTPQGLGLLVTGSIVGACLAAIVFAASALAVPMLLVRRTDVVSAARASLAAIAMNPAAMALWAALIVVMMTAGFLTLLVGLVVAFPLIGHATWHAYVDIYGD